MGLNSKIHLAVDAHGMPVRVIVTEGTRADCKEACALIDGLSAGALWLIEATIRRVFSAKQVNPVSRLSSRQREVVKYHATMTESSTKSGILSRMLFSISSAGGELPHDMPKDVHLFLPPFKSDAYLCGQT